MLQRRSVRNARTSCAGVCLAAIAVATAVPAAAQETEGEAETEADDRAETDSIIVTGERNGVLQLSQEAATSSRLGLTIMETPAAIDVISKEMIRSLGDRTVHAAAARAPGMINTSSAFGYSLSARGFTGFASSVAQLYDGMRIYQGVDTFPVDPWMAERVEVLRGAASVLYGEGGIGGAINVVRKQPNEERHEAELLLSGGSFNTFGAAAGAGGPINDKLSYRIDVSFNRSDGWVERGNSRSLAISGALRYRPTETLSLTLTHDRADLDPTHWGGTPLRDGKLVPEIIKNNYGVLDDRLEFNDSWTQAKIEWSPSDQFTINNVLYYTSGLKFSKDSLNYTWVGDQIRRSSFLDSIFDNEQVGNRLNAVHSHSLFGLDHRVSVGAEYNWARYKRSDNSPNNSFDFVDPYDPEPGYLLVGPWGLRHKYTTTINQYAIFGESKLSLSEDFSLVTGLRYDRPEAERDDVIDPSTNYTTAYPGTSWRLGAVYNPSAQLSLYAQYSRAVDPVTKIIGASLQQAEFDLSTGRQLEAGLKAIFLGGRAEFTFAAYRIVKKKILTRSEEDPTLSVQVGQQSSRGLEASLGITLTEGLSVLANGTVLEAEYDDFVELVGGALISRNGNTPADVPEVAANLWLSWVPVEALRFDAGLRYVGSQYSDSANAEWRPGFTVVDASARYSVDPYTRVGINVRNLLDKLYVQGDYSDWVLGDPRSISVTLERSF